MSTATLFFLKNKAQYVYTAPATQFLLVLDLKISAIKNAKTTAAVTPALAADSAPVIAENTPFSAPRIAPFASRYPNPEMGTVAPAPAKSTRG